MSGGDGGTMYFGCVWGVLVLALLQPAPPDASIAARRQDTGCLLSTRIAYTHGTSAIQLRAVCRSRR